MDPEPGEQIFFHSHPSWRSILGFYAKGIVASVLAGALVGVIKRIQTTYTITNRRLTIDAVVFSRELHETRLARVQNVGTKQRS